MEKTTFDSLVLVFNEEEIKISFPYSIEVYNGSDSTILYQIIVDLMNKVKALEDKIKKD